MIALGPEHEETLREHARRAYPEECCGALLGQLGSPDGESASVRAVQPIDNARADERRRRYLVEPADYLSAERTARALGLALLGFYHSHPDHPAVPSAFDREHAWPHLRYVIVAVAGGDPGEMRSWRLAEDRAEMTPETLVVLASPPPAR